MTGNEMITQLGRRMEDVAESIFTSAIKLDAINNALLKVCMLLDRKQLRPLVVEALNGAATNGEVKMSTLTTPLIKEGDDIHAGVFSLKQSSGGNYIHFREQEEALFPLPGASRSPHSHSGEK